MPPPDDFERMLVAMEEFARRMCACTSEGCMQRVWADLASWVDKQPPSGARELTSAEQQRATAIGTRLGECMERLMDRKAPGAGVP